MVTAYAALIGAVALERGVELTVARRNLTRARAHGAVEHGAGHYPFMVLLHGSFLVACPLEVALLGRPFFPWLAATCLVLVGLAQALRYWCIATLGERWNTRVVVFPDRAPVARGPYRWLNHPNYVAVVVEIVALPLVHAAWLTAIVYSLANALLLRTRIAVENRALGRA